MLADIVILTKYVAVAVALGLPSVGASIGIFLSTPAIAGAGTERPETIARNLISIVLSEALAIYGLIVGLLLYFKLPSITTMNSSMAALSAGLTVGLTALCAGIGIGGSGRAMAKATAREPALFSRLVLGIVFSEALAIYGLVTALLIVLGI